MEIATFKKCQDDIEKVVGYGMINIHLLLAVHSSALMRNALATAHTLAG